MPKPTKGLYHMLTDKGMEILELLDEGAVEQEDRLVRMRCLEASHIHLAKKAGDRAAHISCEGRDLVALRDELRDMDNMLVSYTALNSKFLVAVFRGHGGADFAAYGSVVEGTSHVDEAPYVIRSGEKIAYSLAKALMPDVIRELEDYGLNWRK